MYRILFVLTSLLAFAAAFAKSEIITGELTAVSGYVVQPNGQKKSVVGMKFPFVAESIEASPISKNNPPKPINARTNQLNNFIQRHGLAKKNQQFLIQEAANTTIYSANAGEPYGYVVDNPSSLDDLVLSPTGVGKAWKEFTFGFHYSFTNFSNFLIRWRIWDVNVDKPAPQNDFDGIIADFGVIWNQSVGQGTWRVTINIAQAGVVAPNETIYMAQQFRDPSNLQGEGPFEYGVETVFNPGSQPSIGSSLNQFWYDWDPIADGAYENTEIDVFEGGFANHLWVITVDANTTVTTLLPTSATTTQGTHVSGDNISAWFENDNDSYIISPLFNVARGQPVAIATFEAPIPTGNIIALSTTSRTRASLSNVEQKVEFFNFFTNGWILVDTRVIGTDWTSTIATYGGILPLNTFRSSTNRVRARVTFRNLSDTIPRNWTLETDQFNWTVVR
ncbi:hypothetical protein QPK87_05980 [Kamptonema cortianum]|nr:hypothetical protein [Geitlerinema splendidum]MDK3156122.1 hypothetical protein [Kamptonema cortianum]